ncbi:LLM class F420-dependent oxidoreductase [Candidatus Leptofilum sp.]|uniref:LLM class F420-dependent oxidoreductase n=1 Tax=Candidatus Leptofilum sp. TaxID=3241576 RepID=UPI003B59FE78
MKFGLQIVQFNWPGSPANIGSKLAEIGKTAESAGFDSIWVMDHFFQMDMPDMGLKPEEPMLDGYTALSYLAAVTERARLGTMVTGVNYRHPGHLLKIVSNLDVLSGGRANLGIGAGWYEREAKGLGFPFPPLKERFERLEETLHIMKQVWSGDFSAYQGKHYQLAEPMNNPQPFSKPHPPILIGGAGEKKTLRLVAQYADACNLFAFMGNDELARKLDVLKRHCDDVGRDYAEIEKTALGFVMLGEGGSSPAELIETCRGLANAGIETFIFSMGNVHDITPIETIGREVIPAVAEF